MKFSEINHYKGELKIFKEEEGVETLLYSSKNIVVSGMGVALSRVFGGDGSTKITDYIIGYYQLGVSGSNTLVASSTSELGGELTFKEYGSNDTLIKVLDQYSNNYLKKNRSFGIIFNNSIKIVDDNTVEYQIIVDKFTANKIIRGNRKKPINEIGLFIKNPLGFSNDVPILVAYRNFDSILKSESFSLIFKWAITKL